jgi:two-component system, OmpR family, sensor histidine kinase ChvG
MSLRIKLLLVALVALVLPWAGFQFVKQMEVLLRQGQEQAQLSSAQALTQALVATAPMIPAAGRLIPLPEAPRVLLLDGSADDWEADDLRPLLRSDGRLGMRLAARGDTLFGVVEVVDGSRQRVDIAIDSNGDEVVLQIGEGIRARRFRLGNAAPGTLQVLADPPEAGVTLRGEWQETQQGYRIEFALGGGRDGDGFALTLIDADGSNSRAAWPLLDSVPGVVFPATLWWPEGAMVQAMRALANKGTRMRLVDTSGRVLAKAGGLNVPESNAPGATRNRWYALLYRLLLAPPLSRAEDYAWDLEKLDADEVWTALSGLPASVWRPSANERAVIVAASVPVRWNGDTRAALVYEGPSEALLVLANRAVAELIAVSLLAVLVAGLVLFGFAGVLSWRIRRLHYATERVLKPDGRLDPKLPHLKATDEIGDLSRSFAKLLDEIGGYNDYLKTLATKLSHELNTPLAIVRSSLDNLDHETLPESARVYADRARDGADRLWGILRSMSEASRMEKAINAADAEDFDLTEVVRGCAESYRQLAGNRTVHVMLPDTPLRFHGAPELIAQALDKLFDNAKGFARDDGWIRIKLSRDSDGAEIAVANSGPPLPEKMQERLFDSLVSMRDAGSLRAAGEVPHLGLGLYIVRLIAASHNGSASAVNLAGEAGVEFRLKLRGMSR